MKTLIKLIIMTLMIFPIPALAQEIILANNNITADTITNSENKKVNIIKLNVETNKKFKTNNQFLKNSWEHIKGQPSDNALNLLMFSYHTRSDRDQMNESNKILGLDYKGYCIGTYNNSYHTQTYYAGITRKVYEKKLPSGIDIDVNYKLMALRGYKYYEFNVGGFTPLIVPELAFSKGLLGVNFLLSPGKTVTFATNFKVNLPKSKFY